NTLVEIKPSELASNSIVDLARQSDCFQFVPYLDDPEIPSAILSLDPFLEADPSFDTDDFYPVLVDQFHRDGQVWGIPAGVQPYVIEYNQDLFDAAGLEYPEANWTLDDFLRLAQHLTHGEADDKQYGFVGTYEMLDLMMFVERLGGQILDDAQDPVAAAFADTATVEAIEWYANLYLLYGAKPIFVTDEERDALIDSGQAAMWATPFDRHDALRSGILPFPQGTSDSASPVVYSSGYFISAQAAAPQACWEWIKFLTTETSVVQGFPARRSVATSDAYRQQVGTERATVYLTSVEGSQRPSVFQRIAGQEWLGAYLVWLEQAYKQIVEEGMLPEEALAIAQDKADDYRACVIASESINAPSGYRECMNQVNQADSVSPSEMP
ncbi:MAG: extracellular solute-binding protein, partial [Anaerolineae bacterium]